MERKRLPDYLKRGIIDTEKTKLVRSILKHKCLNTVCEAARCPNKAECYAKNTKAVRNNAKFTWINE